MEQQKTQLWVSGMHCTSCALGVHKLLENKGLENIKVDYLNNEVEFNNSTSLQLSHIIKDIEGLGYQVQSDDQTVSEIPWYQNVEILFYICLLFTLPLVGHMFLHFAILHNGWFQLALCIPVYFIGIFYFGKSAFKSLKLGLPNMDVLIFTGATAAFIYSLIGSIQNLGPQYHFYETTATIITLVLLGNIFEKNAVKQTTSAMQQLSKLQKTMANVMLDNQIIPTLASEVKVDAIVLIKEGDTVPVDGKIISGNAEIDESMLSGESVPVEKSTDNEVFAGSLLIKGTITVVVTKAYNATALSNIINMVKNAYQEKPKIQKLGDQIAGIFVPVIIGISLFTFVIGYFVFGISFQAVLMSAIAVLVISCPCAMGLATPTAVMVGLGRAAKQGILIKGAQTIEELAKIQTIVFDKTGTLTTGDFRIENWKIVSDVPLQECENMVFALEQYSNHPIAKSLVKELEHPDRQKIYFKNVMELKGLGIEAEDFKDNTYRIGSAKLFNLQDYGMDADIFLFKNEEMIAAIKIMDALKANMEQTMLKLKYLGIETVLLSGDKLDKCEKLAQKIGITTVYAEKLPEHKLNIINKLKKEQKTAMVGDGINDGPALTTADIGISLAGASDIAMQSSQVILLNNEIENLPAAIAIARATYKTIKQNLFWALAYNIVAVPMAAFGFLSPMLGVFAMACSDVVVIGNSLFLKIKKLALR